MKPRTFSDTQLENIRNKLSKEAPKANQGIQLDNVTLMQNLHIVQEQYVKTPVIQQRFDSIADFFNELFAWSYGIEMDLNKLPGKITMLEAPEDENKFSRKVDMLQLISHLTREYEKKCGDYKFRRQTRLKGLDDLFTVGFSENFWDNIFNDYDTYVGEDKKEICLFNRAKHSIGSYLHSAHPDIHYFHITASGYRNPICTAILMEGIGGTQENAKEHYLIVEGVLGNFEGLEEHKEEIYSLLWNSIKQFAFQRREHIFVNGCHSGSQQEPEEFIQHVSLEENIAMPLKVLKEIDGKNEKIRFTHKFTFPDERMLVQQISHKTKEGFIYRGEQYADVFHLLNRGEFPKKEHFSSFFELGGYAQGFEVRCPTQRKLWKKGILGTLGIGIAALALWVVNYEQPILCENAVVDYLTIKCDIDDRNYSFGIEHFHNTKETEQGVRASVQGKKYQINGNPPKLFKDRLKNASNRRDSLNEVIEGAQRRSPKTTFVSQDYPEEKRLAYFMSYMAGNMESADVGSLTRVMELLLRFNDNTVASGNLMDALAYWAYSSIDKESILAFVSKFNDDKIAESMRADDESSPVYIRAIQLLSSRNREITEQGIKLLQYYSGNTDFARTVIVPNTNSEDMLRESTFQDVGRNVFALLVKGEAHISQLQPKELSEIIGFIYEQRENPYTDTLTGYLLTISHLSHVSVDGVKRGNVRNNVPPNGVSVMGDMLQSLRTYSNREYLIELTDVLNMLYPLEIFDYLSLQSERGWKSIRETAGHALVLSRFLRLNCVQNELDGLWDYSIRQRIEEMGYYTHKRYLKYQEKGINFTADDLYKGVLQDMQLDSQGKGMPVADAYILKAKLLEDMQVDFLNFLEVLSKAAGSVDFTLDGMDDKEKLEEIALYLGVCSP